MLLHSSLIFENLIFYPKLFCWHVMLVIECWTSDVDIVKLNMWCWRCECWTSDVCIDARIKCLDKIFNFHFCQIYIKSQSDDWCWHCVLMIWCWTMMLSELLTSVVDVDVYIMRWTNCVWIKSWIFKISSSVLKQCLQSSQKIFVDHPGARSCWKDQDQILLL